MHPSLKKLVWLVIALFLGTSNATAALRALSTRTASALARPATGRVNQPARFLQHKAGRLQGRGNWHQIRQSKSTKAGESEVAAADGASSMGPKTFKDDPKVIWGALAGGFAFSFAYMNWMLDNAEDEQQVDRMWDALFENDIVSQIIFNTI